VKLRVTPETVEPVWRAMRDNLGGFDITRLGAKSTAWLVLEADWEP